MNARIIVYLLIGAFVLPGCARFKEKLIEAKKARDAQFYAFSEENQKAHEEFEAKHKEHEKHIKEFDEFIKQAAKDRTEYNAWYDSLPSDKQAYITRELEERQIRYNQIHGFNPDGSSRYDTMLIFWDDRLRLMYHYKPIWDNLH